MLRRSASQGITRKRCARALFALLVACACGGAAPGGPARGGVNADEIAVDSIPMPLRPFHSTARHLGRLDYRGGVRLSSADARFGGLSGLLVSGDGRSLIAISDHGYRVDADLVYDPQGDLAGIERVRLSDLRGPKGGSLAGTRGGDAEDLARAADEHAVVIAFESRPRLWQYPAANALPERLASPPGLENAPRNAGIEALTRLADGRLLALTEGYRIDGGTVGWLSQTPDGWSALTWRSGGGFEPTGAATLPDGDVLVLERRTLPPGARLRVLKRVDVAAGAVLDGEEIARFEGPVTFDNMEGIDARRGADGETLIYLVSDDNYMMLQRTLLLMFRFVE
ncbi:MAG: esterase-like activity of phytase family protein [Rhodospirillales bacterium]|nr:esterase-like activity of phytase family protein [Rhodospirillales bacterium]